MRQVAARSTIPLRLKLGGQPLESETTYTWAGAHVLTIHTAVPRADLALELHSTFVGHPAVAAHSVHLILGPRGVTPAIEERQHDSVELDPTLAPRACVYEHAQRLIEILGRHGYDIAIDAPGERTFDELERGVHGRSH